MKIAVLISGGVDSSVALCLLRQQKRHDIEAYYLKIWLEDELSHLADCPWEEDLAYAREVCEAQGVPLQVLSLQREYYERVVQYAVEELRRGRTPSPDIFCNRRIKFGLFGERIDPRFEKIASGHYARIRDVRGRHYLLRAPDPVKDQTYFLSRQRQDQIARSCFPIGNLWKREVREIAKELDLPNKFRKDSQGICFLGKIRYPEFVRHYLGEKNGVIVEKDSGRILGEHRGYWFYTVGQRQGLGLGGGPWYDCGKDVDLNRVYVTHKEHIQTEARRSFELTDLSWIVDPPDTGSYTIKIRHGPAVSACDISWVDSQRLRIVMENPDAGVAPGQFGVLYDGEVCLGSGVIA